jgi:hypothetical protein
LAERSQIHGRLPHQDSTSFPVDGMRHCTGKAYKRWKEKTLPILRCQQALRSRPNVGTDDHGITRIQEARKAKENLVLVRSSTSQVFLRVREMCKSFEIKINL